MQTFGLVITTALLVAACAARVPLPDLNQVSPEVMNQAVKVKIYGADEAHSEFDFKTMVEGHSCKHLATDIPPSRAEAIMRMKVDAVQRGANGILDYTCESYGTDAWGTNCWASITCRGVGVWLRNVGAFHALLEAPRHSARDIRSPTYRDQQQVVLVGWYLVVGTFYTTTPRPGRHRRSSAIVQVENYSQLRHCGTV